MLKNVLEGGFTMNENLIVIRNIFYKCFIIGFLMLIIAGLIYMPNKTILASFYGSVFGIDNKTYYLMWVCFVGLIKTILIFLFLVPALALHWQTCKCRFNK